MKNIFIIIVLVFAFFHINRTNNYISDHFREMAGLSFVSSYYDSKRTSGKQNRNSTYDCIVLVIIDGLRADHIFIPDITPRLSNFARSNGIIYSEVSAIPPTVSAPCYMSIVTGAPAFIHGVTSNARRDRSVRLPVTIFESLKISGMESYIIGFEWYKEMFGGSGAGYLPAECCEKDDPRELAAAVSMLFRSGSRPALTLVHFLSPDNASHKNAIGAVYNVAVREVDSAIGTIIDTVTSMAPRTLFIITADHGAEKDGTHGGEARSTKHIPLYFYTASLPPRTISRPVTSLSIAPTLAAHLDVCIPPLSCGTILCETMDDIRAKKYLQESIAVKERFLEGTGRKSTGVMNLAADDSENLTRRDNELTKSILDIYPSDLRSVPFAQRVACFVLLVCLTAYIIFRSQSGAPFLAAVNGLFICSSGLLMPLINSQARLTAALSLMSLATLAFAVFHHYHFSGDPKAETAGIPGSETGLLALLMAETLFIAGFFIPLNPPVPDLGVYPFRFFFAACVNTIVIFLLLVFSSRIALHAPDRPAGKKND
jgi:hypothetical protein